MIIRHRRLRCRDLSQIPRLDAESPRCALWSSAQPRAEIPKAHRGRDRDHDSHGIWHPIAVHVLGHVAIVAGFAGSPCDCAALKGAAGSPIPALRRSMSWRSN
jgi:hypothetical protein